MQRYTRDFIDRAKSMVNNGMSLAETARELNINRSLLSTWSRGVNKSKYLGLIRYNEQKRRNYLELDKQIVDYDWINLNAKCLCSLLYGCEGSKYPAHNGVAFANSDPNLILAFVNLLRKSYKLDESRWRVHLQIHDDQNFEELRDYWSKLLKISDNYFIRPTITHASEKKHRNGYIGTCTVRYGDYSLQLRLIGIFEEFLRKCND